MAWFAWQSALFILLGFLLGVLVGWWFWRIQYRRVAFTESEAVTVISRRHEKVLAEKDAELGRLEALLAVGARPVTGMATDDTAAEPTEPAEPAEPIEPSPVLDGPTTSAEVAAGDAPAADEPVEVVEVVEVVELPETPEPTDGVVVDVTDDAIEASEPGGVGRAVAHVPAQSSGESDVIDLASLESGSAHTASTAEPTEGASTEASTEQPSTEQPSTEQPSTDLAAGRQPADEPPGHAATGVVAGAQSIEGTESTQATDAAAHGVPAGEAATAEEQASESTIAAESTDRTMGQTTDGAAEETAGAVSAGDTARPVPAVVEASAAGERAVAAAAAGASTDVLTAEVDGGPHAAEDDLERIEGIGPRIASALRIAGIGSFRRLADADVPTLQVALEAAGLRLAPSLPTWSRQARFLADGDEVGFIKLTESLVAGREPGRSR